MVVVSTSVYWHFMVKKVDTTVEAMSA